MSNPFQQRYQEMMDQYHQYFEQVRASFKQHCEEIKQKTQSKLKEVPESEVETRQQIYAKQKVELDEALSELKQLLNFQSSKMRQSLEAIKRDQESQQFDLDQELAKV